MHCSFIAVTAVVLFTVYTQAAGQLGVLQERKDAPTPPQLLWGSKSGSTSSSNSLAGYAGIA